MESLLQNPETFWQVPIDLEWAKKDTLEFPTVFTKATSMLTHSRFKSITIRKCTPEVACIKSILSLAVGIRHWPNLHMNTLSKSRILKRNDGSTIMGECGLNPKI